MAWPELLKAKDNIRNIEREIERLLREHNSFMKKEIARHHSTLLSNFDASLETISKELEEFNTNIKNHKKYLDSKARFMKRHYARVRSF